MFFISLLGLFYSMSSILLSKFIYNICYINHIMFKFFYSVPLILIVMYFHLIFHHFPYLYLKQPKLITMVFNENAVAKKFFYVSLLVFNDVIFTSILFILIRYFLHLFPFFLQNFNTFELSFSNYCLTFGYFRLQLNGSN